MLTAGLPCTSRCVVFNRMNPGAKGGRRRLSPRTRKFRRRRMYATNVIFGLSHEKLWEGGCQILALSRALFCFQMPLHEPSRFSQFSPSTPENAAKHNPTSTLTVFPRTPFFFLPAILQGKKHNARVPLMFTETIFSYVKLLPQVTLTNYQIIGEFLCLQFLLSAFLNGKESWNSLKQ